MIKKDKFNDLIKILEEPINQSLYLSGQIIKAKAKKKFKRAVLAGMTKSGKKKYAVPQPLDSIHERSSWLRISIDASEVKDFAVRVGTPVKYGLYNEIGGIHLPPRPFLGPAAYESIDEIKTIFSKITGGKIKVVVI